MAKSPTRKRTAGGSKKKPTVRKKRTVTKKAPTKKASSRPKKAVKRTTKPKVRSTKLTTRGKTRQSVSFPKNKDGTFNVEALKRQFMASAALSWKEFLAETKYSEGSYSMFPTQLWVREKRSIIMQQQTDSLAKIAMAGKGQWTKEVLATIIRYPKSLDKMMSLLEHKAELMMDDVQNEINLPPEKRKKLKSNFDPYKLERLAQAFKNVAEAKYKALLIHDFTIKLSSKLFEGDDDDTERNPAKPMEMKLIDVKTGKPRRVTTAEMTGFMQNYFDRIPSKEKS